MFDFQEELRKLPDQPGVYIMHDKTDAIIYIGKAVSLRKRVRQYFQPSHDEGIKKKHMVEHIARFEYIITDSELEALVLECNLIKEHTPKYNTMLRDDKTYPYIRVTVQEDFPRVLFSRQVKKDKSRYFGPYTSAGAVKDTIELINKLYKLRTCSRKLPRDIGLDRACLNYHIHQCGAPCQGYVDKETYGKQVSKALEFLNGNYAPVLCELKEKMQEASEEMEFERAIEYRELLNSVSQIAQKQKITNTDGEDKDIIALASDDRDAVVQVFFIRSGKIIGRDHFHVRVGSEESTGDILVNFVKQYYSGTPFIPRLGLCCRRTVTTVQECRMGEDGIHFGAGKGKLQVTGSGQITFRAPEISLDAVQKIGQYKMESMAKEKAGMLYSGGNGNPSTGGGGDGAAELQNEYNALSSQGILAGTEYEYYKPFDDAPEYEEYKEVPTWLKAVAGVAVAAVVGLAVGALVVATGGLAAAALGVTAVQLGMTAGVLTAGAGFVAVVATAASDKKNGTESSLGDYISNAFWASARVGGSCIAITLGMYGAEVMTMTVSGGLGLIPVGGTVVTLPQLAGAFLLVAGTVTSQNLLFQMREVLMFCISGKEMGAPTGNWLYDSARELTEMASMQFAAYGLRNPYTYQRPKITPQPNETGLTVPGGTGVAVVPNGTAPALKQPYLPGQYTEYPAAVQGWAQQALPGWGSGIEGGNKIKIQAVIPPGSTHPVKVYTDGNAQINIGKIDTYIRGKVELDVEATITRIDELKDIRKLNPESFTKEMKKELQECENRLHNYQRSQEMNNTLNEAGIEDSIENNQMIVENLLDAAKEVTDGNTEIISYIEGVNGKVQVVSRWKILPDGTPYLATVILKPMK